MIPFPHYGDFTAFTPVVPELYWNVYSAEERVKALCMEWVKLTAYTQALADTVNEQYDDLKADIQARYDALDAAVQNIDNVVTDMNERFPELVNEQVNIEIRRLITSGEFAEMLQAAIDEYWTQYGQRLSNVETDVQTLSGDLTTERNARIAADGSLSGELTVERNARIAADEGLDSRLQALEEQPILLIIGDSWSRPESQSGRGDWITPVAKQLGAEVKNFAQGGMGFAYGTNPFTTQVNTAISTLTAAEKNRVKWVCVVGGVNDAIQGTAYVSQVRNAVNSIIDTCGNAFPNATIHIGINMCALEYSGGANISYNCYVYAYNLATHISNRTPLAFAMNTHLVSMAVLDSEIFLDNLHLNAVGGKIFSKIVYQSLTGGIWNPHRVLGAASTVTTEIATYEEDGEKKISLIGAPRLQDGILYLENAAIHVYDTSISAGNKTLTPTTELNNKWFKHFNIAPNVFFFITASSRIIGPWLNTNRDNFRVNVPANPPVEAYTTYPPRKI